MTSENVMAFSVCLEKTEHKRFIYDRMCLVMIVHLIVKVMTLVNV